MAICSYCGDSAGLFKRAHPACVERAEAEEQRTDANRLSLRKEMYSALLNDPEAVPGLFERASASLDVRQARVIGGEVFADVIGQLVRSKSQPTIEALEPLAVFAQHFKLMNSVLPNRAWNRFVMLATLADLNAGRFPNRVEDPLLGFAYERDERIAWVFGGARYLEDRVQRQSSGLYQGISLRVVDGLYVHAGTGPRTSVVEGLVEVSEGNLVVTDRTLWYQGPHGVLRIGLNQIAAFQCFGNGFGICQSHSGSRNQAFVTGDGEGWFAHALVTRIALDLPK